jgi:hypothetical protein
MHNNVGGIPNVYRRVSTEDLRQAVELRKNLELGSTWMVAPEYKLQGDEIVASPLLTQKTQSLWAWYEPLERAPDLFLKFARLYEEPNFEMGALKWCHRYGFSGERDQEDPVKLLRSNRMSISAIREEVSRARLVLLLYEAVLNRDEKAALRQLPTKQSSNILERARDVATGHVEMVVSNHCFPSLVPVHPQSLEVKSSWFFKSLLGAMYLQMFWLMALGGNVSRCEYCARIISLAPPHPEVRKPRRDKRFCNDACRQANHRSKRRS